MKLICRDENRYRERMEHLQDLIRIYDREHGTEYGSYISSLEDHKGTLIVTADTALENNEYFEDAIERSWEFLNEYIVYFNYL